MECEYMQNYLRVIPPPISKAENSFTWNNTIEVANKNIDKLTFNNSLCNNDIISNEEGYEYGNIKINCKKPSENNKILYYEHDKNQEKEFSTFTSPTPLPDETKSFDNGQLFCQDLPHEIKEPFLRKSKSFETRFTNYSLTVYHAENFEILLKLKNVHPLEKQCINFEIIPHHVTNLNNSSSHNYSDKNNNNCCNLNDIHNKISNSNINNKDDISNTNNVDRIIDKEIIGEKNKYNINSFMRGSSSRSIKDKFHLIGHRKFFRAVDMGKQNFKVRQNGLGKTYDNRDCRENVTSTSLIVKNEEIFGSMDNFDFIQQFFKQSIQFSHLFKYVNGIGNSCKLYRNEYEDEETLKMGIDHELLKKIISDKNNIMFVINMNEDLHCQKFGFFYSKKIKYDKFKSQDLTGHKDNLSFLFSLDEKNIFSPNKKLDFHFFTSNDYIFSFGDPSKNEGLLLSHDKLLLNFEKVNNNYLPSELSIFGNLYINVNFFDKIDFVDVFQLKF